MLHLIFQSSVGDSILQRIESGDDVVFHENAVFCVYRDNQLTVELQKMLSNGINFYVISDEIESRGLDISELVSDIELIDYSGLVELTEKNKVILTWS